MSLGEKIKKIREAKGISQEKLAQLAEITVSTVYKIEKDKINPSFAVVVRIAKGLGVSVGELG